MSNIRIWNTGIVSVLELYLEDLIFYHSFSRRMPLKATKSVVQILSWCKSAHFYSFLLNPKKLCWLASLMTGL